MFFSLSQEKNISTSGSNETDNAIWFGLQKISSPSVNSNISYYVRVRSLFVWQIILLYGPSMLYIGTENRHNDMGIVFVMCFGNHHDGPMLLQGLEGKLCFI